MVSLADVSAAIPAFMFHYHTRRPVQWAEVFGAGANVGTNVGANVGANNHSPLPVVEIGCGLGEFLVRSAAAHRNENFVGIEQEWARVKKTLRRIVRVQETGEPLNNVKVMQTDAVVAFERLFDLKSIARIHCLFPCPWPKKKHVKRRLFSREFLRLMNSRLVTGGTVEIVTDFAPYFEWMQTQAVGCGFALKTATLSPQFDTKFERKWKEAGQKEFFQLILTKRRHIMVALKEDVELKIHFSKNFDPDRFALADEIGPETIIAKNFLYDPKREAAMVRVIVAEKNITQHVWISIALGKRGWCISKAEGQAVLPTVGVAKAIEKVYRAVAASAKSSRVASTPARSSKHESAS
jgi:tRNA (guanine-N7-)-methyltransferase